MWLLHSIDFSLSQNNGCAFSVDKCFLYEPVVLLLAGFSLNWSGKFLTLWLKMWCIRFWIIWLLIPHMRFKELGVRTCEIKHDPGLSHILVVYKKLSIEWVKFCIILENMVPNESELLDCCFHILILLDCTFWWCLRLGCFYMNW
jgi:hypothetical protein